ncbi:MAG: endonuclease/exonuclease/phosphatase family protein [Lachnospiraceae bacterium]|nr:endonuclease/exonuclease/phosphatase family protein [Lachnospiraceae bacterium]
MKALTLNIYSHPRKQDKELYHRNIDLFSQYIADNDIDVIAIQESSQTHAAKEVPKELLGSFLPCCEETVIKEDNCTYLISKKLEEMGFSYNWTWCYAKIGYDIYNEGLSIMSRYPILDAEEFYISKIQDVHNWKSRKVIGVKLLVNGKAQWFYSVHMGWWKDEVESFTPQMQRLHKILEAKEENVFMMGDFNSQSDIRGEGYDYVKSLGWIDTYDLAQNKDDGITVQGKIDGWDEAHAGGMRIDYIWSKEEVPVVSSKVVFSGKTEEVISDHFGVMITIDE